MSSFVCLISMGGEPIVDSAWRRYGAKETQPMADGSDSATRGFAVRVDPGVLGEPPVVARYAGWSIAGQARLDDRTSIAGKVGAESGEHLDLELVLATIEKTGERGITALLGDFAFVAWHPGRRVLIAARDAFGVKTLYYRRSGDIVAFASRPSSLTVDEMYDEEFAADYLIAGNDPREPCPYAGVETLPSGTLLRATPHSWRLEEYWSPAHFDITEKSGEVEQCEMFRELFARAVLTRLADTTPTWAELSGGLDSSSVVSMSHWLVKQGKTQTGIAATLTISDSIGGGDERRFVEAVVRHTGVRSEVVEGAWPWQDDGAEPPRLEIPHPNYPFYARDRRCLSIVRSGEGHVVLTGQGGDQYLSARPYHIADHLSRGEWRAATRETARWAIRTRQSFWQVGWETGLLPLLPGSIRARLMRDARLPAFIRPDFARRYDMLGRHPAVRCLDGRWGRKYARAVAYDTSHFGRYAGGGDDNLEFRHPFLYRPLVEFGLQLPVHARSRPSIQKWVLRVAMKGILTDEVRLRTGKGGADQRIAWALTHERNRLEHLLRDPLISQLGWVDAPGLREAVEAIRIGRQKSIFYVTLALSLETWLRVRAGLWNALEGTPPRAQSSLRSHA